MPDLNPSQQEAVRTLTGPLLVLAGAGSGKTRVITYRIANLIRHGVPADRILAVTFTNKAAREMKHRATALLGKRLRRTPEISTFHSLCVRILRRRIEHLGYPSDFTIYDRSDQESIARTALRELRIGDTTLKPSDLVSILSGWKSSSLAPDQAEAAATNDKELLAARSYERYQNALRVRGAVDFDDLLHLTEILLRDFPRLREEEAGRFDRLLVDEYQDTNGPQYRIVKALAEGHRNLCVVGDDDQSIYAWRGADVRHILGFQRDWPDAKVIFLEENYRSVAPILEAANVLIKYNTERHGKVLRPFREGGEPPRVLRFDDESLEAVAVVNAIRQKIDETNGGLRPGDFAILFRTNEQPRPFELELRRAKLPYKLVGGKSFYDRKEVRDVLAYLRVLARPSDEASLLRVINTPPRGIGDSSLKALLDDAVQKGVPLWDALPGALERGVVTGQTARSIEAFRRMLVEARGRLGACSLAELAREFLARAEYQRELERTYTTAEQIAARSASIEEVINALAAYEGKHEDATLTGFVDEMMLADRDDPKSEDQRELQRVTLMTLHSAKGLEFRHVTIVGMEEGLLPHKRAVLEGGIGEERRLAYVGVTRAQDSLTLTCCKARMKWGKLRPQIASRFLMELRGDSERAAKAAELAEKLLREPEEAPEARASKGGTKPRASRGRSAKEAGRPGPTGD